jgi:DNA-directed RNA polymerase subunit M/transcription elongation factor TFIIS
MIKLYEHNSQMMSQYGLEGQLWKTGDVACPKCEQEVAMLEQVGVLLTSNPPKIKVKCPECKLESYKIV